MLEIWILRRLSQSPEFLLKTGAANQICNSACQSNTTKLFGLMSVVLVLVRSQAGGFVRVIDYTKKSGRINSEPRI